MIPRTAEYALRAMVWLAARTDEAQTSRKIADATQIPPGYLYKVLQALTAAKLIRSQPGPSGGYTLLRHPTEISLLDVVSIIAPVARIHACPLRLQSHGLHLCRLHQRLDDAFALVEQTFRTTSLTDLMPDELDGGLPLCETAEMRTHLLSVTVENSAPDALHF